METITFGTRGEADRVTRRVRFTHARVSGEIETAAGPYPAGTPYPAYVASLSRARLRAQSLT